MSHKTDKITGWGNLVPCGMDPKESPSHRSYIVSSSSQSEDGNIKL